MTLVKHCLQFLCRTKVMGYFQDEQFPAVSCGHFLLCALFHHTATTRGSVCVRVWWSEGLWEATDNPWPAECQKVWCGADSFMFLHIETETLPHMDSSISSLIGINNWNHDQLQKLFFSEQRRVCCDAIREACVWTKLWGFQSQMCRGLFWPKLD